MSHNTIVQEKDALSFCDGTAQRCYKTFGAHVLNDGVFFAVWVPGVKKVRVVGDFNNWDNTHEMRQLGSTGVWTLFIKDLEELVLYKYQITTKDNQVFLKADPFAFFHEIRPGTSSMTYGLENYQWSQEDTEWLSKRSEEAVCEDEGVTVGCWQLKPLLIYEVHLGSWKRHEDNTFYTYREFAEELAPYAGSLGYTHIQLMPVMEHLVDDSLGYQVSAHYSVSSRFGTPHDFMAFIDICHKEGLGVILDWIPSCFCRDERGLCLFNGQRLYEAEQQDSEANLRFDFSKKHVWSFLIANALYYFDVFHIDGLRMDITRTLYKDESIQSHDSAGLSEEEAVSKEMIPLMRETGFHAEAGFNRETGLCEVDSAGVDFIRTLNSAIRESYPGTLLIAQELSGWQDVTLLSEGESLGFDFKWDSGWSNDTLRYVSADFLWRPFQHRLFSSSSMYLPSDSQVLPLGHQDFVEGKPSLISRQAGDYEQKFAGLRVSYCYFLAHPGKKLAFMGMELAQFAEWNYHNGLEWFLLDYDIHGKHNTFVREANHFYTSQPALWAMDHKKESFIWIDAENAKQGVFCFVRKARRYDDLLVVILNMSPTYYDRFRVGVPTVYEENCWPVSEPRSKVRIFEEVLNSDATHYGGSGKVNEQALYVDHIPWNRYGESVVLSLPPLTGIFLKPGRL